MIFGYEYKHVARLFLAVFIGVAVVVSLGEYFAMKNPGNIGLQACAFLVASYIGLWVAATSKMRAAHIAIPVAVKGQFSQTWFQTLYLSSAVTLTTVGGGLTSLSLWKEPLYLLGGDALIPAMSQTEATITSVLVIIAVYQFFAAMLVHRLYDNRHVLRWQWLLMAFSGLTIMLLFVPVIVALSIVGLVFTLLLWLLMSLCRVAATHTGVVTGISICVGGCVGLSLGHVYTLPLSAAVHIAGGAIAGWLTTLLLLWGSQRQFAEQAEDLFMRYVSTCLTFYKEMGFPYSLIAPTNTVKTSSL